MTLRVMTYNILTGGTGREDSILNVIQTVNPHLVILQEVTDSRLLQSLSESLQMQWYFGDGNRKTRVALLSKLPVLRFASAETFPIWHNVIEAEVRYQANQSLFIIGVHLIPHLWFGFELWRYWEIRSVLASSKKRAGQPLLVAGDFNAIAPHDDVSVTSAPASIRAMLLFQANHVFQFALQALHSAGFTDAFRFLHPDEKGFTYPTVSPSTRFDYFFSNPELQTHLKDCWVVHETETVKRASDHYPLVTEFDLKIEN